LSVAGRSSFEMKIANRKVRLYLCFIKHQTVKKKCERRTLEIHLLIFALTVDGFQWEALDRFSPGKAPRMPIVLIGCWI